MKPTKLFSSSQSVLEAEQKSSHRMNYLLNEKTPFDVMEAFRSIKANLSVSVPKKPDVGTVIMTTSPLPSDGKTTVSVNLALMFALSDAKVVVIDADIRRGRVGKFFKQKREPGLSNYLSGQVSLQRMLYRSKINQNLSYITCGTHSPRPYELLESQEMANLIEELRSEYDYVIIDTPPILLVSDALAFTHLTDGAVLVCRHMESNLNDIQKAVKTLEFAKANILGVVVNDFKGNPNKKYGYSYRGYGSYKYSYNYGTEQPYRLKDSSKKATSAASKAPEAKVEETEKDE